MEGSNPELFKWKQSNLCFCFTLINDFFFYLPVKYDNVCKFVCNSRSYIHIYPF